MVPRMGRLAAVAALVLAGAAGDARAPGAPDGCAAHGDPLRPGGCAERRDQGDAADARLSARAARGARRAVAL